MFRLAIRHILTRKSQSILTFIALILGSGGYVAFSAMMLGFQTKIQDNLIESTGHINISVRNDYITEKSLEGVFFRGNGIHWQRKPAGRRVNHFITEQIQWENRLENDPRVISYSPMISRSVIIQNGFAEVDVTLHGIDPDMHGSATNIESTVKSGNLSDLRGGGALIFAGTGLMKTLGVQLHDTIILSMGGGEAVPVRIIGTFESGSRRTDDSTVYASLRTVQQITASHGHINSIIVKLRDFRESASVASEWSAFSQDTVESWDQVNERFKSITKTQNVTRLSSLFVLVLVIAFGIYNILNMSVVNKKKEIAILRSMGYERIDIILLFLYQGIILGVSGSLTGLFTGWLASLYMETIELVPGMGGMFISFDPVIYIQAFLIVAGASVTAGFLPSWKAGRMKPIQVIREAD